MKGLTVSSRDLEKVSIEIEQCEKMKDDTGGKALVNPKLEGRYHYWDGKINGLRLALQLLKLYD